MTMDKEKLESIIIDDDENVDIGPTPEVRSPMPEEKEGEIFKKNMYDKLNNFFSDLQFRLNIFQINKKNMDLYLASDFNVFDYIIPARDEYRLSFIIKELLDPEGKHGQGAFFLKEFLRIIDKSEVYNSQICKIRLEEATSYIDRFQRRIDIIIDFDQQYGIGIENKPWAGEQREQIKDYIENLRKKYNDSFILVYLSGGGDAPQSIDEKQRKIFEQQGRLKVISYPDKLKNWLESCYKETKAEKIRWFLKDFIEYVENNF